jgi:hypothetical protein
MAEEQLGRPTEIVLGNFAEGEVPDPVEYEYLDWEGNPIDVSASDTFYFDISLDGGTPFHGSGTADAVPGEPSKVAYAWHEDDMASGHYEAMFWAITGTTLKRASVKILWWVGPGVKAW